jgi:cytochrome c oxidase assembly protein subunit 15
VDDPRLLRDRWLFPYAILVASAALVLIAIGGLVTSHGVGMAVPDWPTSYGYNMFLFPVSKWVGGILYEHTHRLTASVVGLLVVVLTRWLAGRPSRLPLAIIGLAELAAGFALLRFGGAWRATGHILSGIAGVVLLAAVVWVKNAPAARPLPLLGWIAFVAVQLQGLLGGLRVVLLSDELGIFHAALAQLFFALLCVIALLVRQGRARCPQRAAPGSETLVSPGISERPAEDSAPSNPRRALSTILLATTLLIFAQLVLGATMRHQHAGLAIPDFPLAYGKLWPATDPASVERYNQQRIETTALNPITSAQILLQMSHRILALVILCSVASCAWVARRRFGPRDSLSKLTLGWLGMILLQALLGAATIWSNKAADIATLHVMIGALSLATGSLLSLQRA